MHLHEEVLLIGLEALRNEPGRMRALRERLSHQEATRLFKVSPNGRVFDRFEGNPTLLPREVRKELFLTALKVDAVSATQTAKGPDFPERVVHARLKSLDGKGPCSQCSWPDMDHPECYEILTLREILLMGRPDSRARGAWKFVDEVIKQAFHQAHCLEQVLLLGLEYQVGEEGKNLSGGQKQKVALARVLAKGPPIIVLDEATSALDEISQSTILTMLRKLYATRTMVAVTHRFSAVQAFDRILVMERGHIVQDGSYESLFKEEGLFRYLASLTAGDSRSETGVIPVRE